MIDGEELVNCPLGIQDLGERVKHYFLDVGSMVNKEISENIFNAMINREVSNNVTPETFNGFENIKDQDVYKVRFHRDSLKDSMETYFEPKDWNDFVSHCVEEDKDIIIDSIKCELYYDEPDTRIGWDKTWIITARFPYDKKHDYPIGFSDRNIMELKR